MSDSVCAVESRFPMKPYIWLSFDGRPWQELAVDDNGTIAVSRIAARTRLRPDSLTVGEVGIFEGITIQDIRSVGGSTAGTARECALPVDGDALQPGPAEGVGEVNWEGVKYYDSLINHLLELDIEPFITLYHWDMPQALEDSIGGWLSPDIIDIFTRYARFCFERWGSKVKYWITFNEIHSFAGAGYFSGEHAPGRCSPPHCSAGNSNTEPYLVSHHALLSHAHVVDMYRKEFKDLQKGVIGITVGSGWYEPLNSSSTLDQEASEELLEGESGW